MSESGAESMSSEGSNAWDESDSEDEEEDLNSRIGPDGDDDVDGEDDTQQEAAVDFLISDEEGEDDRTCADEAVGVTWNKLFKDDAEDFNLLTHQPNSELRLSKESNPVDVLQKFMNTDMINTICEESLRYAVQEGRDNFDAFNETDFWRFFAMHLGMGIGKKPNRKLYWSKNNLFYTPFFGETMSRDRFLSILQNIHFVNNREVPANNTDRFKKLGSFLDELVVNFKTAVHPGEFLCLDESLVPFKGRLSIKQYNPKKRARFGVKMFVLADCNTKMILDIVPYQGKHTKMKFKERMNELGFGGTTVLSMLEPYFGLGHRVVVDNWFNSPTLARILKERKTYILGTVQKNRKGMPKGSPIRSKLAKGFVQTFSDGDVLIERWHDRREVFMLNTFMDHIMVESESKNPSNSREKPGTVLLYNSKMGAVDDADRIVKPYKSCRKSYKWYRKIAFHLMDLAVYNSYLLYQQLQNKKIPYLDYLQILIKDILQKYPKPAVSRGRPSAQGTVVDRLTGPHFPEKSTRSNCAYCKEVYNLRVTSLYKCMKCKKRFCIDSGTSCFYLYHTQSKLKKIQALKDKKLQQKLQRSNKRATSAPTPGLNSSPAESVEDNVIAVSSCFLEYSETYME